MFVRTITIPLHDFSKSTPGSSYHIILVIQVINENSYLYWLLMYNYNTVCVSDKLKEIIAIIHVYCTTMFSYCQYWYILCQLSNSYSQWCMYTTPSYLTIQLSYTCIQYVHVKYMEYVPILCT